MKRVFLYTGLGVLILGLISLSSRAKAQGLVPVSNFTAKNTKAIAAKSIIETISSSGRSQLTELITKAGLIAQLSGKSDYTFFAPSDEAIAQLLQFPADKLHGLLLNHLVSGEYKSEDFREGTRLKTMGGSSITIIRKRDTLLINGIAVTTADEKSSNGIIHTLSSYLQ